MRRALVNGYDFSRVIKGGWHLAGDHGLIDPAQAVQDMAAFVEAGITTFDCADIYTGVEMLIGDFRAGCPALARQIQIHTKFVPDLEMLPSVDAAYVESCIDRSLRRLRLERLDLVQFHWWDYAVPGYVEAAEQLAALRRKGKIANIGVTNFDVPHLAEILEAGVPVVTLQAQYSLLDVRPQNGMIDFCTRHGIELLCYGTVAGGFLSERWLRQPEPSNDLANRSLIKYKLIIEDFGGWRLFQELLGTLSDVSRRHGCDIATVASSAVLAWQQVAAVIVGATDVSHLAQNVRIDQLRLDPEDTSMIGAVLSRRQGPNHDVYSLERDRRGRHGRIMKYNLHRIEDHATK